MGCYGNISLYNKWASLNEISQLVVTDSSVLSEKFGFDVATETAKSWTDQCQLLQYL